MKHIFETTVRGLVEHYPTYNTKDRLAQMVNGDIVIANDNPKHFMRLVSNTDSFVLSFYLVGCDVASASIYFCDGSLSLTRKGSSELHPYSIGGYWTVRDIFMALENIFKMQECTCPVFDALFLLAESVEKVVVNELKGIVSQFGEHRLVNEHGLGCDVIFAVPNAPSNTNHQLVLMGGDSKGRFQLEFEIGVYFIDIIPTINQLMDQPVPIDCTGVLYTDIRGALVKLIKNASIASFSSDMDNNFVKASLIDAVEILVPQTEVEDVADINVSETTPFNNPSDYDIIADFCNRVLEQEQYDVAMYTKHQYAQEVVLLSKINSGISGQVTELELFRLSLIDGIAIVNFSFHDPACVVTAYILPCYDNMMLDKVTIILRDENMYKRGISTIHGITRDVAGIMNGAMVALSHAVGPQYGRFTTIMENINPLLTSLAPDLKLNSKVIYPVT